MSIATKLAKLKTIKQDIKSALEEKGQTPSNVFSTYANNIRAIEAGGSGGDTSQEDGLVTRTLTSYSNDRVNSVGEYTFYNIKTLTNVELPNITSIGTYAFYNCTSLTNIDSTKVTFLGQNVFQNCTALLSASMPLYELNRNGRDSNNLFYSCSSLKNVYMPKVTRFGSYIFYKCTSLESIDFPLLQTISDSFCRECTNLKQVNLPKLRLFGSHCFENCTSLTNISLPSGTRFASYCFQNCSTLDSVDVGKLEKIDDYVFVNCYSLKSFTILNKIKVASLYNTYVFNNCYHILGTTNATYNPNGLKDGYIYVPASLLSQYKVATNWSSFASQIVGHQDYSIGDSLVNYSNSNYSTCKWYSDKEMTNEVSSVEQNGRYYCRLEV